jgi:hypothetical protein
LGRCHRLQWRRALSLPRRSRRGGWGHCYKSRERQICWSHDMVKKPLKGYSHYLSLRVASDRRQRIGLFLILSRYIEQERFLCSRQQTLSPDLSPLSHHSKGCSTLQGCQIFLGTTYQNRGKYQISTKYHRMGANVEIVGFF